ncbi:MAG: tRNA 2-thiouridine(34) synthase MnmA [Opitutales bacterium]|nr:tRNA 2-thiouridine(34) synthase MnmA [Opitutales bacterium]
MEGKISDFMEKKLIVALSGGVDSAVAAAFLREAGHDVHGVYMKNWINEEEILGDCPWQQDIRDAEAVAATLGIGFEVVNFMRDYRERVVDYLVRGYASGLTPNPDVMCNREMKFGVLLDWARERGFEGVATGHYCQSRPGNPGRPYPGPVELWEGADKNKDQSYFLALLRPEQLAAAWFPVGHLEKPALRAEARRFGLPNAEKKDSQGICFIGRVRINDFLEHFIPPSPGPIVNLAGEVLGEHKGLHRYTLGQRRGIGLPSNSNFNHYVVVAKDLPANKLVVAFEKERPAALWQDDARLHHLSWLTPQPPTEPVDLLCKVRYRDPSVRVRFEPDSTGARLVFAEPQRGLASGQVAALYDGERLLGGGVYV